MKFIILLSHLIYITQVQASFISKIRSKSTRSLSSHPVRHASGIFPTNDTDISGDDFLNRTGDKIHDTPNRVILHIPINLRTHNTAMRSKNRRVDDDAESDHMGQIKLKRTSTLKRAPSVTNMKSLYKSIKKRGFNLLQDENNVVEDVLPEDICIMEQDFLRKQSVPQVNKFEKLVSQESYDEMIELGENVSSDEFLNKVCSIVKTFVQYKGVIHCLKCRKMVASFYVYGDIKVVREAIFAESEIYDVDSYINDGSLETAIIMSLKEENYDRVVELLNTRQEMTAEWSEQSTQIGEKTSFENFVYWFLRALSPLGKDGMTLKRFLTLHRDELRDNHPDILDTICQELVFNLISQRHFPNSKKLLTDLIGQSSLLTSTAFIRALLLLYANNNKCSNLVNYGWREVIEEGLNEEYWRRGEKVWRVMENELPIQFTGSYPPTPDAIDAVFAYFPTKRELEEQWDNENVPDFREKLDKLITNGIFPRVLMEIIIEYAVPKPTWIDV